ncbi:hypothetical protein [Mesorhizobium sp. CA16]|uniref:DUF6414 family protein n=1 Tax=Mesorhizobium sp. CA16 TaxID=588496 RepID=UPI001CCC18CF|nr:hypothetical protein [Mesorhizobium sp. CA16]MBZ9910779.1 hypothetical protein [Mesorhizobium sp. CA16]
MKVSDEGQGEHHENFVLDFLYNDARRIGSFLAQFEDSGTLQQVTQHESVAKGNKRGWRIGLGGGANIAGTGGTGEISFERSPAEVGSEASELVFDPLWANALTLLDYLAGRDLIEPNIAKAGIGQFVKVTGNLRIHDLGILKLLWDIPAVRRQMGGVGSMSKNQAKRLDPATKAAADGLELGIEVMKVLPHGISARLTASGGVEVWASLHSDSITGSTADLFLKHGDQIAGQWSMLGVLDAEPTDIQPTNFTNEESGLRIFTNGFSHILDVLGPLTRMFLGRPSGAYGMTPLVIYREVARR